MEKYNGTTFNMRQLNYYAERLYTVQARIDEVNNILDYSNKCPSVKDMPEPLVNIKTAYELEQNNILLRLILEEIKNKSEGE